MNLHVIMRQIGNPSQNALIFNYLIESFKLKIDKFLFIINNENLSGQRLAEKF